MTGQPEGRIVRNIQAHIKARGGVAIKTHPAMGVTGLPDLLCCYRGLFLALEIKHPDRRSNVSRIQRHWLDTFQKAGATSAVHSTVDQTRQLLNQIDAATQ